MKHQEGNFKGAENISLYYQTWQPEEPKAVIGLVHGLGEHGGRYMNVVNGLVPKGFAMYALDTRGHGRSEGQRGHVNNFDEVRRDIRAYVELMQKEQPGLPLFLYGHSLGGLITLYYVLNHPEGLRGVIISAPALGKLSVSPILLGIGQVLSRFVPTAGLNTNLDATAISRDTAVVAAYQNDPLVHGKGSAKGSAEVVRAIQWVEGHARDWKPPLLMFHGTADRLTSPEGSRTFFENVTIADKKYISYPDGYHETHNDIHYPQLLADLEAWLTAHL